MASTTTSTNTTTTITINPQRSHRPLRKEQQDREAPRHVTVSRPPPQTVATLLLLLLLLLLSSSVLLRAACHLWKGRRAVVPLVSTTPHDGHLASTVN